MSHLAGREKEVLHSEARHHQVGGRRARLSVRPDYIPLIEEETREPGAQGKPGLPLMTLIGVGRGCQWADHYPPL